MPTADHTTPTSAAQPEPAAKQRGGARKGAGKKAPDGAATRRVQLSLDVDTQAIFAELGGGNVSLGARIAARMARAMPAAETAPAHITPTGGV